MLMYHTTKLMRSIICPWESFTFYFWGHVIGGVISAIGGAGAAGEANALRGKGDKAIGKQEDIYGLQLDTADSWMDRYNEMYAPIEAGLAEKVQEGPQYERAEGEITADVAGTFDKMQGVEQRRLERYGLDPSSGRSKSSMREYDLERGKTEVMGRNKARVQEDDRDWARKFAFSQMGRGLETNAANLRGDVASGYGGIADRYYGQAGKSSRSAGRGMATAGKLFGGAMSDWGGWGGGGDGSEINDIATDYGGNENYED